VNRRPPDDDGAVSPRIRKGRGAQSNADGRYEPYRHEAADDGWGILDEELPPFATRVFIDSARRIITRNSSPDIPFDQSINPYRGCEHGCVYCYARPTHAYLGLSPGLDFETQLFAKPDAAKLLARELARPGYRVSPIALGANTDPYQPVERRLRVTRGILETLSAHEHPLTITTKGALVERDIDLLAPMAQKGLAAVFVSITTLDAELARRLEPRASSPQRRLDALRALSAAGIPAGVMFAPVIPALNDDAMEAILDAAAAAGARHAGKVLLRLPHEIGDLFRDWLATHFPLKAERVIARIRDARGGRDNDPRFGHRVRGHGEYADMLQQRFRLACRRLGLDREPLELDMTRFRPPAPRDGQLGLFG
jgi:DNA repair photolyase